MKEESFIHKLRWSASSRVAGLIGMVTPFFVVGLISVSIFLNPSFTFRASALSELGASEANYRHIFNLTLTIGGLLLIVFFLSLFRLKNTVLGTVSLWLLLLSGMCFSGIGIFPLGVFPHDWFALLFFGLSFIGLAIFGLDRLLVSEHTWAAFIWSNLQISLIALMLVTNLSPEGLANYQIIAALPILNFVFIFGARLYFSTIEK